MRISIFVPAASWLNSAGVRIRYDRLRPRLEALGYTLSVIPIDEIRTGRGMDADIALITKVYDGRAIAVARALRAKGARVGIDVFDDYFSQLGDPRFMRMRSWLSQIGMYLDFGLCATAPMRDRLAGLLPGLPVHVLNDPHGGLDEAAIAASVAESVARAQATREIAVGWFGIGDNPNFQVGLDDLAAFGSALSGLRRRGWSARLRILTNARALNTPRLEGLTRLPLPWTLDEWSEERQDALLRTSLVCAVPVNAQPFSSVKSMNRAITALAGGAQVLSLGYPLYAPVGPAIYRDTADLLDDLERGEMRLRRETLPDLRAAFAAIADPESETAALTKFLKTVIGADRDAPGQDPGPLLMVHGASTSGDIHKTVQQAGALSVAPPWDNGASKLLYDLEVRRPVGAPAACEMSRHALAGLRSELRAAATKITLPPGKNGKPPPGRWRLELPDDLFDWHRLSPVSKTGLGPLALAEVYGPGLQMMRAVAAYLYESCEIALTERQPPHGPPPGTVGSVVSSEVAVGEAP